MIVALFSPLAFQIVTQKLLTCSQLYFSPSPSLIFFIASSSLNGANSVNTRPEGHTVWEEGKRTREARTLAPWWVTLSRHPRNGGKACETGEGRRERETDRAGGVDKGRRRWRRKRERERLWGLKRRWRWRADKADGQLGEAWLSSVWFRCVCYLFPSVLALKTHTLVIKMDLLHAVVLNRKSLKT